MKKLMVILTVGIVMVLVGILHEFNHHGTRAEDAVAAANHVPIEVLFEHQLNRESVVLYRTIGGDDLSLAFLRRSFTGVDYVAGIRQFDVSQLEEQAGLTYVVLPKGDGVPFTIYAGTSTRPELNDVFITEPGFQIAHNITMMESRVEENIYVWMAISPDFTGAHFNIIGVDAQGVVVADIENDGTLRTIHTVIP